MEELESFPSEKSHTALPKCGFGLFDLKENGENDNLLDIDLKTFLKDNYDGIISLFTRSSYNQLRRPLLVIFHEFKLKDTKLWIDKLYEVAQKFPNSIQFAVAESFEDVELFQADCNELFCLGFDVEVEPYVFAIDADERQHHFNELFTIDDLTSYCEKLAKNEIYRSDPIPIEQNIEAFVDIIVADNFEQLVEENDKDVFVTLHSAYSFKYDFNLWGVPKELKADSNTLVFYGINAHTNYIPLKYRVTEFPTSFMIQRNNKNKRLRHDHKSWDYTNLKRFIAKNATTELRSVDRMGCQKEVNPNFADEYQRKFDHIINKLTILIERKLPSSANGDNGFLKFLNNILNKVGETERDNIKVELLTLASKRVNEVLKTKADSS